jgi:NAD-dependent SIR2 family protein deacetylase
MSYELLFNDAAELVAQADALVICAGAGMGVDSGLPDFRGNEGFWRAYPALARAQMDFADVANPKTFENDPTLAWGFYGHRLDLYRHTVPHEGFNILRTWSETLAHGAWVFTSNIDGQFQKAGFLEADIHECHGSIHYLQCLTDCGSGIWSSSQFNPEVDVENCQLLNAAPRCPNCGSIARPNILMFGDWRWLHERMQEQRRREKAWFQRFAKFLAIWSWLNWVQVHRFPRSGTSASASATSSVRASSASIRGSSRYPLLKTLAFRWVRWKLCWALMPP